jgi:hypothetical protein
VAERRQAALPLFEAAALYGAYRWAELRLFEVTGGWAQGADDPAVQLHLDAVSAEHAFHAELWAARLPVLDGVDPEALTRLSGVPLGPLFAALAATESTAGRLAALWRVVVPRLLTTYDRHLRRAAPVADLPAIRALRLVRRDERESLAVGEALLRRLCRDPAAGEAADAARRRLEAEIAAGGGSGGLVAWPAHRPR